MSLKLVLQLIIHNTVEILLILTRVYCDISDFDVLLGKDCPSAQRLGIPATFTIEMCLDVCQNIYGGDCSYVTYNIRSGHCWIVFNVCSNFNDDSDVNSYVRRTTAVMIRKLNVENEVLLGKTCEESGTIVTANNLVIGLSLQQCSEICKIHPDCVAVVHQNNEETCALKSVCNQVDYQGSDLQAALVKQIQVNSGIPEITDGVKTSCVKAPLDKTISIELTIIFAAIATVDIEITGNNLLCDPNSHFSNIYPLVKVNNQLNLYKKCDFVEADDTRNVCVYRCPCTGEVNCQAVYLQGIGTRDTAPGICEVRL